MAASTQRPLEVRQKHGEILSVKKHYFQISSKMVDLMFT